MLNLNKEEIIRVLKPLETSGDPRELFRAVSTDTRTLQPGDLYVALKGEHFDGNRFVPDAVQKGAAGVITSDEFQFSQLNAVFAVKVRNTLDALQELGQALRLKSGLKVVGVTGSNGKTTTKEWVAQFSARQWGTHKTEGTKNNHIGVPLTLLGLREDHQVAVVELGMSALGEIAHLAEISRPDIGIVTSVSAAHMETMESIENVFKAKKELVQCLDPEKGIAVLNNDDSYVARMAEEAPCRVVTFGLGSDADYQALNVCVTPDRGIQFDLSLNKVREAIPFRLNHLGIHNVYNCLAAVAAVHQMGADIRALQAFSPMLKLPAMRLEREVVQNLEFINDAYNANPKSMEVALNVLDEIDTDGKKIFVCGDMLELGMVSEAAHLELGNKIYESDVDVLISYGHESRHTAKQAIEAGMNADNVFVCMEKQGVADILQQIASPGDVVLLKGSRKNQLEKVISYWRKSGAQIKV